MSLVRIQGTDFIRDTSNMSLINNNIDELEQYKLRRKILQQQRQEIDEIKTEVYDIKKILLQMLESKG